MDAHTFYRLAECLTGTPVKELTGRDESFLTEILQDDAREIDCSQLNELLLVVNKDRMTRPFFERFFRPPCRISALQAGVERFQTMAMRRYGNFIYAYKTLCRLGTDPALLEALGECASKTTDLVARYQARSGKLIDVEEIPRAQTPLVGYLSAGEIIAEGRRAAFLRGQLPPPDELARADWNTYEVAVIDAAPEPREHRPLQTIIAKYQVINEGASIADFSAYLDTVTPLLEERQRQLLAVRDSATRNQDIYLTWDHMDVYFATSMRKRWEFEDLFDFVSGLMKRSGLSDLKIRYFDPTQSYTADRINKGLVESLMLKRAKCTVYSVQDTDTLGKDSELAATLAQGKPVIAYVPRIIVADRANELLAEDPVTIQERLRFVLYADEYFAASLEAEDLEFVQNFHELERFERSRIWKSLPDPRADTFRAQHADSLGRLCQIIAASEARIYDKRAGTLTTSHPLAVQVNLDTGVANGVLVVRNVEDCERLLRAVLTNAMEFDLQEDNEARMWYLREKISGCVFRVVSKDRKLTNCFWNFYLQN